MKIILKTLKWSSIKYLRKIFRKTNISNPMIHIRPLADSSHVVLIPTAPVYPLRAISLLQGYSVQLGKTYQVQSHCHQVRNFFSVALLGQSGSSSDNSVSSSGGNGIGRL